LAFDQDGNLYFEYFRGSWFIAKLSPSGAVINDVLVTLDGVDDLKCAAGYLFVSGTSAGGVEVYDLNGSFVRRIAPGTAVRTLDVMGPTGPAGLTFTGTVVLSGWLGGSLPSVMVSVDGGAAVSKALTGAGTTGTFTVTLPASGSHTVKVKAPTYTSVSKGGSTPTWLADTFALGPGDVTNDNMVEDFDFEAVVLNFGGAGPAGDCNGDGVIEDFDFAAVVLNFGNVGS
jgi:hypothetical protein